MNKTVSQNFEKKMAFFQKGVYLDSRKVFNSPVIEYTYSRTSLTRTRLFRITAYLEVKIWSLF